MPRKAESVIRAFEDMTLRIAVPDILPMREVRPEIRKSVKYSQIAASIREVGIIEPPVVVRDPQDSGRFRLLDGHLRLDILLARGIPEVLCLVATPTPKERKEWQQLRDRHSAEIEASQAELRRSISEGKARGRVGQDAPTPSGRMRRGGREAFILNNQDEGET
jgi:hypothetical protein